MSVFSKAIDEITVSDVAKLKGTPESGVLEFKQELPTEKGLPDPWLRKPTAGNQRATPSSHAKQKILRELVAFSNSEGGYLVLGLEEVGQTPSVAGDMKPLPECAALAERFSQIVNSSTDPPLPGVRVRGISTNAEGDGVVLFHVPRSPLRPHRVSSSGEVTVRYETESKAISMRQVQDMMMRRAAEGMWLDKVFEEAQSAMARFVLPQTQSKTLSFRCTLAPESGPLALYNPMQYLSLCTRTTTPLYDQPPVSNRHIMAFDLAAGPGRQPATRPLVRGGRCEWISSFEWNNEMHPEGCTIELFETGVIRSVTRLSRGDRVMIPMEAIIFEAANALAVCDSLRSQIDAGYERYVMEVEIRYDHLNRKGSLRYDLPVVSSIELAPIPYVPGGSRGTLGEVPLILPRYPVGARADFPDVLQAITQDLYNAVGAWPPQGFKYRHF